METNASLIKNKLVAQWPGLTVNPEDIFCVTVTPSLAKKDAIKRTGLVTKSGIPETDTVLATREWEEVLRLQPVKLADLKPGKFDALYGEGSQFSRAFAIVRTAYKKAQS